jgi:ornithine carbamoyltransferase
MKRDLISLAPYATEEIEEIFSMTRWMKDQRPRGFRPLDGKTGAMIFEKPSLRTHISFEVGVLQLGGNSIFLSNANIGLSSREAVRDAAEVMSRYNDFIIARTFSHSTVAQLAQYATIPVVNALTDFLHPCQIMADAFTLQEHGMLTPDTKIVFVGDGNNVANSWLELAEKIPLHFVVACPEGFEPDATLVSNARRAGLSRIEIIHDPAEAASDAGVLYTDVWVSMGQEEEKSKRHRMFKGFQVNTGLLSSARRDALVMHCLPAHRGEEITGEVLEGPQSIVLEQAENRLHVQKGILAFLFGERTGRRQVPHMRRAAILA